MLGQLCIVFSQELQALTLGALDDLEARLVVFVVGVVLLLVLLLFVVIILVTIALVLLGVVDLLMVDTVVQLAVVVKFVLTVDLSA